MKSIGLRFLSAAALAMFMLMPSGSAVGQAQGGYWDRQDDRWERGRDRRDRRRDTRNRRDRRDNRRDNRRDGRDAGRYNDGYYNDGSYGRDAYGQGGYGRGYGRDSYPNYGGSFELRQTALNAGYNEGSEEGRKDRQRNERFDFQNESKYRNATKDYNSRLGDRSLYQRYYRMAFETGYRDGYYGHSY